MTAETAMDYLEHRKFLGYNKLKDRLDSSCASQSTNSISKTNKKGQASLISQQFNNETGMEPITEQPSKVRKVKRATKMMTRSSSNTRSYMPRHTEIPIGNDYY